ncbi:MAG: glutamine--fructose-6-phosphate transaminase (isomerizing) [Candidatus Omnitrophica bacterium]|nr:glutamine--fructose-6-phosphate transaminase (isomerizing) [Candidatus Omnitrophota bacterium]
MCGITGYVGHRNAVPLLLAGLEKLEYRGYDSSGIGIVASANAKIEISKAPGKIKALKDLLALSPLSPSTLGISHSRWATHGAPSKANAHPHFDCTQKILVVHNGIIENYEELKDRLMQKGHKFLSQTDTEVVAHLIEEHYQGDFLAAVQKALKELKGSFALGILCRDDPDTLIAARLGSPLIIGVGKNENFIASDVPAILDQTKKVIYLKDGEVAVLKSDSVAVYNLASKKVSVKVDTVKFSVESVQKQGFAHFMLKEMHEQPDVIAQILKARVCGDQVVLDGLGLSDAQLKKFNRIFIVACGTAYHAGLLGKYLMEKFAHVPVGVEAASEFRYREQLVDKKTLIIAISQSGETADTLAAVKECRAKGAKIIAICNVVGSSLTRESDGVLYTHAGPEIGVASTKAYTAQLTMLYLLALKLGNVHAVLSKAEQRFLIGELRKIPEHFREILKSKSLIAKIAKPYAHFGCFLFLGRNINYPSALEGALKLKEISYIPAEGYAAGEMKHGPIALIDEYRGVVCIAPQSDIYEKMISNMQEIRARKGKIIAIATAGDEGIKNHSTDVIYIPKTHELLTPLLAALPLQLLAYSVAVHLGCDVDQPRNLAKSVTVE